jgi:hypothetical protein
MKRNEIINKLVNEGLSEKTLSRFSDRQINELSKRFFGEGTVMISKKSPTFKSDVDTAKKENKTIETYEQEKKKSKKEEVKEDGWDSRSVSKQFKKINTSKKRNVPKGDNVSFTDDDKVTDDFYKKLNKSTYNSKTKTLEPTESVKEVKEWVENVVENNYHPFTSKNEIMDLIKTKLNEVSSQVSHGPNVKKGHNDIPEFMTYDSIKKSKSMNSPKPSPSTKPGPGVAPSPVRTPSKPSIRPKPDNPFSPKPGEKSKPKAIR